jgi:hypothetical protein
VGAEVDSIEGDATKVGRPKVSISKLSVLGCAIVGREMNGGRACEGEISDSWSILSRGYKGLC